MKEKSRPIDSKHIKEAIKGSFKGGLSSVLAFIFPVIGNTIIGAWDGYWNSRKQEAIDQIASAIIKLGEDKIDKEYVLTEEFMDLFNQSLRIRIQSRSHQKAQFILGMLVETMQKDRNIKFSTSIKETFLSILDQLTEEEMIFLSCFSKGDYIEKSKSDIYQICDDTQGIAVDSLIAKGILREDDTWAKHVVKSKLGEKFLSYLIELANNKVINQIITP